MRNFFLLSTFRRLLFTGAAAFSFCTAAFCLSNPPENRPADFRVNFRFTPGMLPYHETIEVKDGGVSLQIFTHGREIRFDFKRGEAEMDRLYNQLRRLNFHSIGVYNEEAQDRGGTEISMRAAGRLWKVKDSGRSFVVQSRRRDYNHAVSAVLQTVKRPPRGDIVFFETILDDSLLQRIPPGGKLRARMGRAYIYAPYNERRVGVVVFDEKKIYPVSIRVMNSPLRGEIRLNPRGPRRGYLKVRGDKIVYEKKKS